MDPASALGSVLAALGLAGAAGLNAWIPLLGLAVAGRTGVVELSGDFDFLESWPALGVLAGCFAVDFIGDKVPAVDHVLHAAGAVVQPAAGALLFAAQTGVAGDLDPAFAAVLGAIVSGGVHAGRAGIRPFSTAGTGGTGNPVLSLGEDLGSAGMTVVAFVLPILAALLAAALLVAVVLAWRALRRRVPPPV